MDVICEVCGVVGYRHLLLQCHNCKNAARHQYCLDRVIFDASSIEWFCGDCTPKPNEVTKFMCDHNHQIHGLMGSRNVTEDHDMLFEKGSNKMGVKIFWCTQNGNEVLETRSVARFHIPSDFGCDDHYSIQLGSIMNEPNVNRVEVTKEPWSWGRCRRRSQSHKAIRYITWGCRRHRLQKARRDCSNARTKNILSGDTFDSSEMFVMKKLKCNDVLKEGESKNDHLIYQPESADGSSHSASDLTVELQKSIGAVGSSMNTMYCLDHSVEKVSCSCSLNCFEGFTQGTKSDLFSLINGGERYRLSCCCCNGGERSYPSVTDGCPTPILDKDGGALISMEEPHPLQMVHPDGTSHLPVDPAFETEEQGVGAGLFASVEDVEQTLPIFTNETSPIWSSALISVEEPHPLQMVHPGGTSHSPVDPAFEMEEQGAESGLFASVEDVEQSHPIFTDEASPVWPSEEQVDGCSPTKSAQLPDPFVVVRPWDDVPNGMLRSKPPSIYSQPIQGSDLDVGNMDVLDPSKEWLDSRLKNKEHGAEAGLFGSVEDVEQTNPIFTDETSPIWSSEGQVDSSSPTSESWEQPDPLEVVRPWDDAPNGILKTKPPSNYSQSMQGPDLDVGNMDVSDPSIEWLDSRLMLNTAEPSSSSNAGGTAAEKDDNEKAECLSGMETVTPAVDNVKESNPLAEPSSSSNGGDSAFEKHNAEMTECLLGMGTFTPALHNVQGSSPSTPKECLVSNADNSDEANISDERFLCTILKELRQLKVLPYPNILGGEVHQSRSGLNRSSDPKPVLKGRISKMMYRRLWFPLSKMLLVGKHHKWKLSLPFKDVSPCKATTKSSFRKKYNGPNRYIPRHSGHKKTKLDMKDRNTDPAHLKSCWPSKQLDHACLSASSELSSMTKEVNDANDAELRYSKSVWNASVPCTRNDAAPLASEVVVIEDRCSQSRMPAVSPPSDQRSFICTHPIDRPYWTGIMKIGQEYISLAAHLSNQACNKVKELSRSLPPIMKVTKHSKLKVWPGRWKALEPTAECIGLYFFSDNMRSNKDLDRLVHYVTDHSLVLKYVFGFDKLLIFPSVFLPVQCQMFQGKHYLCGVFNPA